MNRPAAPPKVLILDAQAPAATAAVQSLSRHPVELHGAGARTPLAFGSRYLARRYLYPSGSSQEATLDWIRQLDADEGYTLVVPSTEISLRILQGLQDGDDLRKRSLLPPRESVEIALDKMKTWSLARRLGIPVPETEILDGSGPVLAPETFPVVLKTVRSQVPRDGSLVYAGACIARHRRAYEAFLATWLPHSSVQRQRYVPGHGMGVECLYEHGKLRWAFAHERLHELPLTGGASTYRRAVAAPVGMLRCTEELLDALGWHGVAMVEYRVGADGAFVLLEVNPRLWGSLPLAIRSGVDFPLGLLRLATGENLGPQPEYRTGFRMRNVLLDVGWMWENLGADHADPLLLTRPRVRSAAEWLLPLVGREGWDHVSWKDPRPALRQLSLMAQRVRRALRTRVRERTRGRELRRRHARTLRRLETGSAGPVRSVTFVCLGNICRGPFAERAARALLPDLELSSAGLHPAGGRPTPARIARVADELGVDLSDHASRSLAEIDVSAPDLIVVTDPESYDRLVESFPSADDRVVLLGLFADRPVLSVQDPLERADDEVREIFRTTLEATRGLARWLGERTPQPSESGV